MSHMTVNERLRNAIFEVIDNQVKANDPPETAATLTRLMDEGRFRIAGQAAHSAGRCDRGH
jgi:hypothetical protein